MLRNGAGQSRRKVGRVSGHEPECVHSVSALADPTSLQPIENLDRPPRRERPFEETEHADAGDPSAAVSAAQPRRGQARVAIAAVLLAASVGTAYFSHYWWTTARFLVSTNDAYVGAHSATLASKIPGYVKTIAVEDNQRVRAGEVIATLDCGDYTLAVDLARSKVATQKAAIERIGGQITAQEAAVDQARAQLAAAQATAQQAQLELERQQVLATREWASRQKLEQAQTNQEQTAAAVMSAAAALRSAQENVEVLKDQQEEARGTLAELGTGLAKAERDLSFAVIRAPFDGVIGNRSVQNGDYVQPGQRLANLVPLDDVYIDAHFKETQLPMLRPGQAAEITIDALPGRRLEGAVVSFAPASGSVFSLLPPDNATGNFTKIVQRVAVRVRVPTEVAREGLLRPGMSVVVAIDRRPPKAAARQSIAAR